MKGKTCAGLWVTGKDKDGQPRSTYLYHVVDSADDGGVRAPVRGVADRDQPGCRDGAVVARHLDGRGVLGPEAFDAVPFLDLLTEYGSPWGQQELSVSG